MSQNPVPRGVLENPSWGFLTPFICSVTLTSSISDLVFHSLSIPYQALRHNEAPERSQVQLYRGYVLETRLSENWPQQDEVACLRVGP